MIIVLDADFAVRPDFLRHTAAVLRRPEQLGILQTPQYFRVSSDNWVERGAAAQQEQFYRDRTARSRSRTVARSASEPMPLYRRSALDERGGDRAARTLRGHLHRHEGRRRRLPRRLPPAAARRRVRHPTRPSRSRPSSTDGPAATSHWPGTPLFKRMKLTPMQRLGLWDGWIFYVTSALSPLVALFVPIVTLAEAPDAITLAPTAMLLPALFTEFYLMPRWLHLPDGQASRRVGLISQVSHLYALRDHLTDRDQEWIPTGGQRTSGDKQGTDRIPDQIATAATWGIVVTVMLLAFRVATGWSLARPRTRRGARVRSRSPQHSVPPSPGRRCVRPSTTSRPPTTGRDCVPRRRPSDLHRARGVLAHARLLVDLVGLRCDAGRLLRVGSGARRRA